jgi:hypothetical protein
VQLIAYALARCSPVYVHGRWQNGCDWASESCGGGDLQPLDVTDVAVHDISMP